MVCKNCVAKYQKCLQKTDVLININLAFDGVKNIGGRKPFLAWSLICRLHLPAIGCLLRHQMRRQTKDGFFVSCASYSITAKAQPC
jgi:hypothetical protein